MTNKSVLQKFYKYYFTKKFTKDEKAALMKEELVQLYKKPVKDKGLNIPLNTNIEPRCIYQADLLYLPEDPETHEKFLLVVVDTANGQTDAYGLKAIEKNDVVTGMKSCFKTLGKPAYLQTDKGVEFTNHTMQDFLNKNDIMHKLSKTGRSRQVGYAEARNKQIATSLFARQSAEQLLTGAPSLHWSDDLPFILEGINELAEEAYAKKKKRVLKSDGAVTTSENKDLLSFGQTVRVQLDKPMETTGQKLSGHFRATDIRFSPEEYTIFNIIIQDGLPPLYIVKKKETGKPLPVGYTLNQLQVVPDDSKPPPYHVIRGKPETGIVSKFMNHKTVNGRHMIQVKWKGLPDKKDWTWEDRNELMKDVPALVKEYEKSLKENS